MTIPLMNKSSTSKKEREIIREIESYGYVFGYVLCQPKTLGIEIGTDVKTTLAYTVKNTTRGVRQVVLVWKGFLKYRRLLRKKKESGYIMCDTNNKRITYECRVLTIVETLVHELTHVIMLEDKTLSYTGTTEGYETIGVLHGLRFSEVYSELCNKYKIRFPNPAYYLG